MQLLIKDAPGGLGEAYQCPFCGLMTLRQRVDETGQLTEERIEAPRRCRRCGSPMDVSSPAVQKFQDTRAAEAASAAAANVSGRKTAEV